MFTSFYVGGTMLILGINPIALWRDRDKLIGAPGPDELDDEKQIEEAV